MDSQSLLAKIALEWVLTVGMKALHLEVHFFSPARKTGSGWLCFNWACKFVVLPFFVATTFEQIWHTGSSVLMGSPCTFGLKPKYFHTRAVAFGFAIIFFPRVAPHEAHLLHSVCVSNASKRVMGRPWLSGECGRPMARGLAVQSPLTAWIGGLTAGGVAVHLLVTAEVPLSTHAPQAL